MNLFKNIFHLAAILKEYMRTGWVRKSQFRVEFFSQVIMDCFWYASHVLTFEILYLHSESIAGWSLADMRVFMGFLFVSDVFMMAFLAHSWMFGRDLKDGKLDPFRVRPGSTIFLYFFQSFSPEGTTNAMFAFGYLFWALAKSPTVVLSSPMTLLILVWALALTCWTRTFVQVGFSVVEFYLPNSDLGHWVNEAISAVGVDRPLDIYGKRFKLFLLYGVPAGALTYVPAAVLVGKMQIKEGLILTAWIFLMGLATFKFWNFSFRKYESAMG